MPGEGTALIAAFCYALAYVFLRKGQSESPLPDHGLFPILSLSVLTLGSGLLLFTATGVASIQLPEKWPYVLLYSGLSGLIGTWLGRMALYTAIDSIGATRGVVIKSMAPLVTLLIALVLLRERLDDLDTTGMICLISGVALVFVDRSWIQQRGRLDWLKRGFVLGIGAAVLQGIGHAMRKLATVYGVNPLLSAFFDVTTAFLAYLLWLMFTGHLKHIVRYYVKSRDSYVMAAGFLSAAGVLLFFTAVGQAPVSTVSVIIGTEPVLVAIFSSILLRKLERLTLLTAVACILVATGVILTSLDQMPVNLRLFK